MILPINTVQNQHNRTNLKNYNYGKPKASFITFKAVQFLEIADKFKPIERDLLTETQKFRWIQEAIATL